MILGPLKSRAGSRTSLDPRRSELRDHGRKSTFEGLELPREVVLDSLHQIRGEVSIEGSIRKYKKRFVPVRQTLELAPARH